MLGAPGFYPFKDGILTPDACLALRAVGIAIYIASIFAMISTFRREPRLRESMWLTGALVVGIAFFLPAVVFSSSALAFFPYAIAHGAQYILMMTVVSGRSSRGWWALATMCAVAVGLGYLMNLMAAWPLLLIAGGLTQAHFLIDAKVWRLREPRQRAIMNQRFDFLLAA